MSAIAEVESAARNEGVTVEWYISQVVKKSENLRETVKMMGPFSGSGYIAYSGKSVMSQMDEIVSNQELVDRYRVEKAEVDRGVSAPLIEGVL